MDTQRTIIGHKLIYSELAKALKIPNEVRKINLKQIEHGIISIDNFVEYAISKLGKLERSYGIGQDFIDGSDAKKTVVSGETGRRATVNNCKNKKGILRTIVADGKNGQVYYFKIPYKFYKGKNSFKILFSVEGGRPTKGISKLMISQKIWDECQVKSIKEFVS
jgi:hypothetical protein